MSDSDRCRQDGCVTALKISGHVGGPGELSGQHALEEDHEAPKLQSHLALHRVLTGRQRRVVRRHGFRIRRERMKPELVARSDALGEPRCEAGEIAATVRRDDRPLSAWIKIQLAMSETLVRKGI
jgi:hypothetical protein